MRRLILGLAVAALCGFASSDASACCHKKKAACAPAPVCAPAPAPVCAPVKKKCCFKMPKMHMPKLGCHKKAACAPAPVAACNTCGETYAAPQGGGVWAASQTAAPQQ